MMPSQSAAGLPGTSRLKTAEAFPGAAGTRAVSRTGRGDNSLSSMRATKQTKPAVIVCHQRKKWVPGGDLPVL